MKKILSACLSALVLSISAAMPAMAAEAVKFKRGDSAATLSGTLKGYDIRDYRIGAKAGQVISVLFQARNSSCYFNVLPPSSAEMALFTGSMSGNEFAARLTQSGNYTIRVYLMRNAARRNEVCKYQFTVEISPVRATEPGMQTDALVPDTQFHATTEVPCARRPGQPTISCKSGVVRYEAGNADVTVFWPDGGSRVLFFRNGAFSGADLGQADGKARVSSTMEDGLYFIRVGTQRFEIPDALVFGG